MKRIQKQKLEEIRVHAFDKKVFEREKDKSIAKDFYANYRPNAEDIDVIQARIDTAVGIDISTKNIEITSQNIRVSDHYVPVRLYQTSGKKDKAVVYIHGGGFISGNVASKDNQCKYLAEQSDALVISVEYRLSPECVFPGALNDCLGVLDWVHTQFDTIVIAGDSAGGNLAAACCLVKKYITLAIFLYGAFDLATEEDTSYHWDYSLYEMDPKQKDKIKTRLLRFKNMAVDMKTLYLPEDADITNPLISPYYAKNFHSFPKVLMIEAEFDYYRICNENFAKKLDAQGIPVEIIDYDGLDHGFFDRIGLLPQAADCIEEIGVRIKNIS